ncbi:hypothetical protein K491DRAFT_760316 [Lophiostoma macrostomum CBS 122681]|uniref:Uncharacterized protein n=1 Tax=Lophiostoma macrostomum CBS 122681 TaxID=1314788 RepID=A0A6A6T0V4_9PLEO|nr:hypothetical protein K491DRAFT_760316 [Lophiostoma macrostomum CBS 122681]
MSGWSNYRSVIAADDKKLRAPSASSTIAYVVTKDEDYSCKPSELDELYAACIAREQKHKEEYAVLARSHDDTSATPVGTAEILTAKTSTVDELHAQFLSRHTRPSKPNPTHESRPNDSNVVDHQYLPTSPASAIETPTPQNVSLDELYAACLSREVRNMSIASRTSTSSNSNNSDHKSRPASTDTSVASYLSKITAWTRVAELAEELGQKNKRMREMKQLIQTQDAALRAESADAHDIDHLMHENNTLRQTVVDLEKEGNTVGKAEVESMRKRMLEMKDFIQTQDKALAAQAEDAYEVEHLIAENTKLRRSTEEVEAEQDEPAKKEV